MKPRCQKAQAEVYTYLDGEMGWFRAWRLRHHLRTCPPCEHGFSFEEKFLQRIHEDCVDDVPEELANRLRAFLRQNGSTDMSAGPTTGG